MIEYKWPLMKDTITLRDRLELAKFVLMTDKFTQGDKVAEFEREWSKWLGCKHSVFVTSGSTANFLLISAIMDCFNISPGDKVLLPSCTWVTNINPIMQLGLVPVFADVKFDSDYGFDTADLKYISDVHPDIKLVFTTHLLGIPSPTHLYKKFWPDALYIDDVCESHGAGFGNVKVGADSLGATFSFYFGHHMSTVEGGMVCTNNTHLYDSLRMKRSHGLSRASINSDAYAKMYPDIDRSFLFVTDGYNFRNTEIGAVLGLSQLKRLDDFIAVRRKRYEEFCDMMYDHRNLFYSPPAHAGNSSFCFPFIAKDVMTKHKLMSAFLRYGIEYRPVVGGNLLRQPYLKGYKIVTMKDKLNVDIIHENGVYIGNNQFVTSRDMKKLKNILAEIK